MCASRTEPAQAQQQQAFENGRSLRMSNRYLSSRDYPLSSIFYSPFAPNCSIKGIVSCRIPIPNSTDKNPTHAYTDSDSRPCPAQPSARNAPYSPRSSPPSNSAHHTQNQSASDTSKSPRRPSL